MPGYQEGNLSAWTEDNVMECFLVTAHYARHKRIFLYVRLGSLPKFKRLKANTFTLGRYNP